MAPRRLTAFLIAIGFIPTVVFAADWDYEKHGDHGPSNWPGICKTGIRQSPIDIVSSHTFPVKFDDLEFHKYGTELHSHEATLYNNGHTVALELGSLWNRTTPNVRDGGLEAVYLLDHVHFHAPSEHTVNGNRFPLEAHLVHRHHLSSSVAEAMKMRDGIAVLGVLFHSSEDPNPKLQDMAEGLKRLDGAVGKRVRLPASGGQTMTLESLLPEDRDDFYRYYGSLTTPQCHEAVAWTVFQETIPISEGQLKLFRMPYHNFRPPQDINHRYVLRNTDGPWPGSGAVAPSASIVLSSILAAYYALCH